MKFNNLFRSKNGKRPLAVRIIAIVIVVLLILAMIITMLPAITFGAGMPLVIDNADILNDAEEQELERGLQSFREDENFDIVVVTVDSLEGYSVRDYADNFYDDNDYGGGEEKDGALILVSMEERDWIMITSGYGITAITDYSLERMEEEIRPDLSAGRYLKAFETFGDRCAECVLSARAGNIIDEFIEDDSGEEGATDYGSGGKGEYPLAANAGIAGVIGVLSSWLVNGRKKAGLKSVRRRTQAKEYMRTGSLMLTEDRDRFLYKTVSRVSRKTDDDKPSGKGHFRGSTIHTSPRGRIHGGSRPSKF